MQWVGKSTRRTSHNMKNIDRADSLPGMLIRLSGVVIALAVGAFGGAEFAHEIKTDEILGALIGGFVGLTISNVGASWAMKEG